MKILGCIPLLIAISKRPFLYDLNFGAKSYKHVSGGGSIATQQRRAKIRAATKFCILFLSL